MESRKRDRPERPHTSTPDDIRTFGRTRGRRLSARQSRLLEDVLPCVALPLDDPPPNDAGALFSFEVKEVWIEIGFGGAEHLVWQADRNPDVGLIGCEPFVDGVVKALDAIESRGLRNVRLHPGDARDVVRWLPRGQISRAFILFPDPWPKLRHHKRRLVTPAFLGELARAMRPGGELRMASDIGSYATEMLLAASASGQFDWLASGPRDWQRRPADWCSTRYEQKAAKAGRRAAYLRFRRRG